MRIAYLLALSGLGAEKSIIPRVQLTCQILADDLGLILFGKRFFQTGSP
jgi:hypothetical protein